MDVSVRDGRVYEFGPFRLDPTRRTLVHGQAPVAITPTVFDSLLYFVEHPGRVVTKDELMAAVWSGRLVEESNVSQTVFTLRRALAGAGATETYLITHPGRGYRFAQPVTVRQPLAAMPAVADLPSAPEAGAGVPAPRRPRILAIAGLVMAVSAGLAAAWWFGLRPAPPTRRVVVLGAFDNLTREPVFDRTFAEATRIALQQSPYLSVLSDPRIEDTLTLMARPADTPMTPALGREICARNNGLAVVRGSLSPAGGRYLMTLSADNCRDGESLAAEKVAVASRDGLLAALDDLTNRLRRRLGESAGSVRDYSVPLRRARTGSLAALQAYSQARDDADHGRRAEAIPRLRQAIALDPEFAAAHADLAVVLHNLKQTPESVAQITLARRSMGGVDARERLYIEAQYNAFVTQDIDQGVRILKTWTTLYPQDASAWANLSNALTWNGQAAAAVEPGRRAVALEPDVEGRYAVLARAELHAGRVEAAQRVVDQAHAHHVDGDDIHGLAYQIAFARRDRAAAERELAWAKGRPGERTLLILAAQGAYSRGQAREGQALFARAAALGEPFGLADITAAPSARLLHDMGLEETARQTLARIPPGFDSIDYRVCLAAFGDAAQALALQQAALARAPTDTLLTQVFAPQVRAALALRAGRGAEAVRALAPALPYEARNFDVPYLRGEAYLAAGQGEAAAAEFRKILDQPGLEPVSVHYPLARLGLARGEAMAGNVPAARRAYAAFFDAWKDADADMPLLRQARAEAARLTPGRA